MIIYTVRTTLELRPDTRGEPVAVTAEATAEVSDVHPSSSTLQKLKVAASAEIKGRVKKRDG